MGRLLRYLLYLIVLGLIGLSGYAVFFELPAPTERVEKPIELDLGQ